MESKSVRELLTEYYLKKTTNELHIILNMYEFEASIGLRKRKDSIEIIDAILSHRFIQEDFKRFSESNT